MKQHITFMQMMELMPTKEGYEVDTTLVDRVWKLLKLKEHAILSERYFTIGKMIEILNEGSIKSINLYSDSDYEWFLDMNRRDEKVFQAKELVDVLWEAVKVVINE